MNLESQLYLRADPSAEGRALLQRHQQHLTRVFDALRIGPRWTAVHDLHWTAAFLDSPQRWLRCLRSLRLQHTVTADDIRALALDLAGHVPETTAYPDTYDVFTTSPTRVVFVVRLSGTEWVTRVVIGRLRDVFRHWEQEDHLPKAATNRVFRSPLFPLGREMRQKKSHVTLARGRVRRERHRDVLRTLRTTALVTKEPITFTPAVLRVAGRSLREELPDA